MKLQDIFIRDAVVAQLSAASRNDAVAELLDALIEAGAVDAAHRDAVYESLLEREKRGSTGFGKGVAVPHAKDDRVRQMVAAIGLSPEGIDFSSLDKQPVYSVVMLLSPTDRPEEHLQAMETIFKHLSIEQFRRFLRQADNADDVWNVLKDADEGRI